MGGGAAGQEKALEEDHPRWRGHTFRCAQVGLGVLSKHARGNVEQTVESIGIEIN